MAGSSDSGGILSWPMVFSLLTALGGIAFFLPPLSTSRPDVNEKANRDSIGRQTIDARLWQDPLQAVEDMSPKGAGRGEGSEFDARSGERNLLTSIGEAKKQILVLAVMIPGGPYAEEVESRLRMRYAVASALGRARYVPTEGEHIGNYVVGGWSRNLTKTAGTGEANSCPWVMGNLVKAFINSADPTQKTHFSVPWEWWHRQTEWYAESKPQEIEKKESVLVLWLCGEMFQDYPLTRLGNVLEPLRRAMSPDDEIVVLGPERSTSLRTMYIEIATNFAESAWERLKGVKIISPMATASDDVLKFHLGSPQEPEKESPELNEFIAGKNSSVAFQRTVASDQVLAKELIDELKLRDIVAGRDPIAVISEWDTLYGRTLPLTFEQEVSRRPPSTQALRFEDLIGDPEIAFRALNIRQFSYLRGIDGRLPGDKAEGNQTGKGDKNSASAGEAQDRPSQPLESPDGRNQADYLRRLCSDLEEWNRECKRANALGYGLRAVGILGSDVYDKLMVLKALRTTLPGVIFFTTDLDARYGYALENRETHNLVIASSFGLKLNEWRQSNIGPFRDSYQASMFLATLMALDKTNVDSGSIRPRLFEVGRTELVDISRDPKPAIGDNASTHDPDVHPPRIEGIHFFSNHLLRTLIAVSLVGAGVVLGVRWWRHYHVAYASSHSLWQLVFVAMAFAGAAFLLVITLHYFEGSEGEPLRWLEGVSVWPTELIRLVATGLAITFIFIGNRDLIENGEELAKQWPASTAPTPASAKLKDWGYKSVIGSVRASTIWSDYVALGRPWAIKKRVWVPWAAYALGAFGIFLMAGFPHRPVRGDIAWWSDLIILVAAIVAHMLLIFYVCDAARVCRCFITHLTDTQIDWDSRKLSTVAKDRDMREEDLPGYLAVRLVAERTGVVAQMIYYPFVVLLLMLLSRSRYFDNWDWPWDLIAVFVINLLFAVYAYLMLRLAAVKLRQKAVGKLRDTVMRYLGTPLAEKAQRTADEMEAIQAGIYARFSNNPITGAILLPLGGLGAWAIIEYFSKFY